MILYFISCGDSRDPQSKSNSARRLRGAVYNNIEENTTTIAPAS